MRRTMITLVTLCLLLSFSCAGNSDSGGADIGPLADNQQVQAQDSSGPDTPQPDAGTDMTQDDGPDLSGRLGGVDCN